MRISLPLLCLVLIIPGVAFTQQSQSAFPVLPAASPENNGNGPSDPPTSAEGVDYRIGRDDLVEVTVFEEPQLSGSPRVTASGLAQLPLIGMVEAAGKTTQELAKAVEEKLRGRYLNDPHVVVAIREYASQPVSVIGAVRVPGSYQLKGEKRLIDVLVKAQGTTETVGKLIQVMRKNPTALAGEAGFSTIGINVEDLLQNGVAEANILIFPGDVINVLNAGSIFVVGEFARPGEVILRYGRDITVTRAVAQGGGLTREAKKKEGVIIRPHANGSQEQIKVDVAKLMDGSMPDVPLMPNDVLFMPSNKVKTGLNRALDSAVSIAVGRAIYMR
jgi:polysaccharide export outer membrane protein